ncbi:hypothetical protein [Bacillus thermotolerans]|uniref:Uncharacterized protein n=1 Tax=Bacillus thermotolerans TaxID=1221996 RepID=A0A0F5HZJ2_BACTR|nr:hypothetical protein [Bacillus thermotolerans]KKB38824.1 hypothetical protein QY97_01067 [Bacillus thermotolerans]KKB42508.1 hypothetical protein QY95_00357 [Bacillus thermotolerans]KKB44545.1 hypothetical protein QY96_02165 [Bacillus thermotolerans]
MIHESELTIFIKELGKLIDEYYKCSEERIKQEIHQDIQLLSSVIYSENSDPHV